MRYGASNAVHICIGVTEKSIHTEKFIQRNLYRERVYTLGSQVGYIYTTRDPERAPCCVRVDGVLQFGT